MANKLTDEIIKNLQPKEKPYRKSAGNGLFIVIYPDGQKRWKIIYFIDWSFIDWSKSRRGKKQESKFIGEFPNILINEAQKKRDEELSKIAQKKYDDKLNKIINKIKNSKDGIIDNAETQIKIHKAQITILENTIRSVESLLND